MDLVIVDARQWQNLFDFRTGEKVDSDNAATRMVSKILGKRPYPGDMEETANRWVTDTALDLAAANQPRLACLSYARQNFMQRITPLSDEQLRGMVCDVFEEIGRFVRESGYVPVIIGTGDMTKLHGEMDLCMFTHMVFGADISIECFSRNLFNQGCIAVLKEKTAGVAVSASSGGRLVSV
jgi:hypothetical protein